jgi:hypothetical protein
MASLLAMGCFTGKVPSVKVAMRNGSVQGMGAEASFRQKKQRQQAAALHILDNRSRPV